MSDPSPPASNPARAGVDPASDAWPQLLADVLPQLRALHRMEVVATTAGGVTHEFNNLLLAIRGNVGLLLMSECLDPSARTRLEQIETAAERATELTRRFQILARAAEGRPALIDFSDAAREAVDLAALVARRKVLFRIDTGPGPFPVLMDPALAVRTLLALCFNAAEAMPDGGMVSVALDTPSASGLATEHSRQPRPTVETMLRVCVRDTGEGLPADATAHVFAPFFTTKAAGRGTGLGLALVREAVESHGGWIECDSAPGHGATFTVFLPLARWTVKP